MILDKLDQLKQFKGKTVFLYPIYKDPRVHNSIIEVLGFVIIDTTSKQTYSLSCNHPDGVFHYKSLDFLSSSVVYCFDTNVLKYAGYDTSMFIDAELQYYLFSNQSFNFEMPPIISHYTRVYPNCNVLGGLVGLLKHEEIALQLFNDTFVSDIQPGLHFYQTELFNAFHNIERNGLKIDSTYFEQRFGQTKARISDYCFTEYNFYTTTGRPSNRFGGINFAALNKEDSSRQCFVSRFGDQGSLLEMDFNAYHPRLIASLLGYDFGSENAYEHLAKAYFNKTQPTAADIRLMKEATFRQIYGGIQQQYLSIPFFFAANELSEELWREFTSCGYIESPLSGRRLHKRNYTDIDRNTLFNYFIQMYETESNVVVLNNLHRLMKNLQSIPILYTYDSILFDVHIHEQQQLIEQILPSCVDYTKFPVKLKLGAVYKDIVVCT